MLKPIKNNAQYEEALETIYKLMQKDLKPNTKESDKLEILSILVEKYEEINFAIEPPTPLEAIKFRMEQLGLKQADIAKVIGGKNRASEILNRKRELTAKMMRDLHKTFNIPAESLLA